MPRVNPISVPTVSHCSLTSWMCAFLVGVLGCLSSAHADVLRTPSELKLGDKFRFVFVTSGAMDATSGDRAVYDAFVRNAAANAGIHRYGGQDIGWNALVSTSTSNALSILPMDNVPIYNVGFAGFYFNHPLVAASGASFWGNLREATMNVNEFAQFHQTDVWTGTIWDGSVLLPIGGTTATVGRSYDKSFSGIGLPLGFDTTTKPFSIYGFSDVLTAVPEPSSMALAVVGAVAVLRFARGRLRSNVNQV